MIRQRPFALVYLDVLTVGHYSTYDELELEMVVAISRQRPYMTFELKSRKGHACPVWHPRETRFFDPNGKK